MKTIIAGSRAITEYWLLLKAMAHAAEAGIQPTEVVSGCARGVDQMAIRWAHERGIPTTLMPANWKKDGKLDRIAGIVRNRAMVAYSDAAIFLWDGESRGTRHCITEANHKGLLVWIEKI